MYPETGDRLFSKTEVKNKILGDYYSPNSSTTFRKDLKVLLELGVYDDGMISTQVVVILFLLRRWLESRLGISSRKRFARVFRHEGIIGVMKNLEKIDENILDKLKETLCKSNN